MTCWDFLNANGGGVALFVIVMTIILSCLILAVMEQRNK